MFFYELPRIVLNHLAARLESSRVYTLLSLFEAALKLE